jgi:hypothetical protein
MDGPDVMRAEERCAIHPDAEALATCARCGSFMCAECRDGDLPTHCAACASRLGASRFVHHVPALGIVMMVQGALTLMLGLYLGTFGGFMARSMSEQPAVDGTLDDAVGTFLFAAMGGIALLHIVAGVLLGWAGWRVRTFHGRVLAFVALGASAVLSVTGCYCWLTALALSIWGLVVLLDDTVRARFAAVQSSDR